MNRGLWKNRNLNVSSRTLKSTKMCMLVHCHNEGTMVLQSTFHVTFFLLHSLHIPGVPDNRLN